MLAVLATALLVTAVISIYRVAGAVAGMTQTGRSGPMAAASALDTLRRDLSGSIAMPAAGKSSFVLKQNRLAEDGSSTLSFHTLVPRRGDDDPAMAAVFRVSYVVRDNADESNKARVLVRESAMLDKNGETAAAAVELIAKRVTRFQVAVLDGDTWVEDWPSDSDTLLPSGARIALTYEDGRTPRTMESSAVIYAGIPAFLPGSPVAR